MQDQHAIDSGRLAGWPGWLLWARGAWTTQEWRRTRHAPGDIWKKYGIRKYYVHYEVL